jgi:hypothetical protein
MIDNYHFYKFDFLIPEQITSSIAGRKVEGGYVLFLA